MQTSWGYQMWECGSCGTYGIAADLTRCPHCGKEQAMPKIAAGAEPSNGPARQDAPAVPQPPAQNAPKADWVAHAVAQGVPEDEAAAKSKKQLIEDHGNGASDG